MIINQLRTYLESSTTSRVFVDGKEFTNRALEDPGRPIGVKIQDKTCIPEGVYEAKITYSPVFKKDLILLSNKTDGSVSRGGVIFTGIRVHAGTTVEHTAGCVLILGYDKLQETVLQALNRGEKVLWVISMDL